MRIFPDKGRVAVRPNAPEVGRKAGGGGTAPHPWWEREGRGGGTPPQAAAAETALQRTIKKSTDRARICQEDPGAQSQKKTDVELRLSPGQRHSAL